MCLGVESEEEGGFTDKPENRGRQAFQRSPFPRQEVPADLIWDQSHCRQSQRPLCRLPFAWLVCSLLNSRQVKKPAWTVYWIKYFLLLSYPLKLAPPDPILRVQGKAGTLESLWKGPECGCDASRNLNNEGADTTEGGSQHLYMIEILSKLWKCRGCEGQRPLPVTSEKK